MTPNRCFFWFRPLDTFCSLSVTQTLQPSPVYAPSFSHLLLLLVRIKEKNLKPRPHSVSSISKLLLQMSSLVLTKSKAQQQCSFHHEKKMWCILNCLSFSSTGRRCLTCSCREPCGCTSVGWTAPVYPLHSPEVRSSLPVCPAQPSPERSSPPVPPAQPITQR